MGRPHPGRLPEGEGTWRPVLGTVVFVLAFAGPIIFLVPLSLAGWQLGAPLVGGEASRWVGAVLILLGLPLWGSAAQRFIRQGLGTPAPVAPPRHLVINGPYRWVRNPMYVAVLAMTLGQALVLGSVVVLLYAALLALAFHLFVTLYEERALTERFGEEYAAYRRRVSRWLPRPPR